ncbi:MAG: hypothetical protein ACFFB2_11140 [Promethearchaeota archaeon]
MLRDMLIHAPREEYGRRMKLVWKVLEDKSTLFVMQKPNYNKMEVPWAPLAEMVSIFAIQPRRDFTNAAKTLSLVNNEEGVVVVKEVFPVQKVNSKYNDKEVSDTAVLTLVFAFTQFWVKSDSLLPLLAQEARKKLARKRSTTHSILKGSGFKVMLITEDKLSQIYFRRGKVPEGITVFKSHKGFHSKLSDLFLRLNRVPTREIQEYPIPDLAVTHKIGNQRQNPKRPVGFPPLTTGPVLVCGSDKYEVIRVIQQLINSIRTVGTSKQIFILDTHSELNGLIHHIHRYPQRAIPLQVFRLGTNIHLNLCDVIVPTTPMGEQQERKAWAAWKSHLISQILLSSLHTSEYLTARYAVPLEAQIRKTAEKNHLFTLKDVSLSFGGMNEPHVQENTDETNMMYADMMAIEAIVGVLEQFRSFPEVNYPSFTGHYGNTLVGEETLTVFQFGTQPPLIRQATVGFLLHYLSQTMKDGCVVLTHAPEFLNAQSTYKRERKISSSITLEACDTIAAQNVLILASQRLLEMMNDELFDGIKNILYLPLMNEQDRRLVITRHELKLKTHNQQDRKSQSLGITEGEGLLFREDAPQNIGFHVKLDTAIPIDLNPIHVSETKQRGSETFGLPPLKYELLMKILKLLVNHPSRTEDILDLLETTKQREISLNQFQSLGLFTTETDRGATYWVITDKGREYYSKQHDFVNQLPAPLTKGEVGRVPEELKRLESFNDISSSYDERLETNRKVKTLIGKLLNYTQQLRATSIPWMRVGEYHDLLMIEALEWQDFRNLFDLAHTMVNNLLLEITQLQKEQSDKEIQARLEAAALQVDPAKKNLSDYLPEENYLRLQHLSQEFGLPSYPSTGILDLYYTLHTQRRSLIGELGKSWKINDK